MERYILPIKSESQLKNVSNALYNYSPVYRTMFRLMYETGLNFKNACVLKVSDLKEKSTCTYEIHGKDYTFPMSTELRFYIQELAEGKQPKDYIFTGARGDGPIASSTFKNALVNASEICGIYPAINIKSIRKTFIYNTYKSDPKKAMEYASLRTIGELYDYLAIEKPDKKANRVAPHSVKFEFFQSDSLGFVQRKLLNTFQTISDTVESVESVDVSYIQDVQKFLAEIDKAADLFNAKYPSI